VGKAAFRISSPEEAWEVLTRATRLALTPPCGPVSVEIAIDVQHAFLDGNQPLAGIEYAQSAPIFVAPKLPNEALIAQLASHLKSSQRPLLWLGGGARGAGAAVQRLVDLGFGVVTSVQGRGVIAEDHAASLGAFQLQRASAQLYQRCDALVIVGSRLRSNETMKYKLALPARRFRIDANPQVHTQAYACELFLEGDASLALHALADALQGWQAASGWHAEISAAKQESQQQVDASLAKYVDLKDALNRVVASQLHGACMWVRDITLSNTMWGNRSLVLRHPRAGVHALGGGIGQGLQMGIGAAISAEVYQDKQPINQGIAGIEYAQRAIKTIALVGDGGFMLNVGELACAAQEQADILVILMNDGGYGVIKNIQDADYGSRHCYVDLHTPDFSLLCASMGVKHLKSTQPAQIEAQLKEALESRGPAVLEVDMKAWGPFNEKFAGPQRKL
jgi:acetolactate synthase I/II/III large subunit